MNAQLAAEQTFVAFSEYIDFTQVGLYLIIDMFHKISKKSISHIIVYKTILGVSNGGTKTYLTFCIFPLSYRNVLK